MIQFSLTACTKVKRLILESRTPTPKSNEKDEAIPLSAMKVPSPSGQAISGIGLDSFEKPADFTLSRLIFHCRAGDSSLFVQQPAQP